MTVQQPPGRALAPGQAGKTPGRERVLGLFRRPARGPVPFRPLLPAQGAAGTAAAGARPGGTRLALLIASLLAGLVIALLTVHLAGKWEPIA